MTTWAAPHGKKLFLGGVPRITSFSGTISIMPLGLLQVSSPLTVPQSFRKIPIPYFTLTQILDTSVVLVLSSSASLSFQNTDHGAIENLTLSIGYGILG